VTQWQCSRRVVSMRALCYGDVWRSGGTAPRSS
jgi:hypothetical protein